MANFFWLPYYDKTWAGFLSLKKGVNIGSKILPYSNGGNSYSGFPIGKWSEVKDGDFLQIATHGRVSTTGTVAWGCPSGVIFWTAKDMAHVLEGFCGDKTIHYELLACYGANALYFSSSFAEKLSRELKKRNMKGSLTALRGVINIGKGQGHQTGTNRFTTGIKMMKIQLPAVLGGVVLKKGGTDSQGPLTKDATVHWEL